MAKKLVPRDLAAEVERIEAKLASGEMEVSASGVECRDLLTSDWEQELEIPAEELMSIDDAASLLNVSAQTLRNWEKEGKLTPTRTPGRHRRYTRTQIDAMRGRLMNSDDIILPDMPVARLKDIVDRLLEGFDPTELVQVTVKKNLAEHKVEFIVDSADGMTSISKCFKMED